MGTNLIEKTNYKNTFFLKFFCALTSQGVTKIQDNACTRSKPEYIFGLLKQASILVIASTRYLSGKITLKFRRLTQNPQFYCPPPHYSLPNQLSLPGSIVFLFISTFGAEMPPNIHRTHFHLSSLRPSLTTQSKVASPSYFFLSMYYNLQLIF